MKQRFGADNVTQCRIILKKKVGNLITYINKSLIIMSLKNDILGIYIHVHNSLIINFKLMNVEMM